MARDASMQPIAEVGAKLDIPADAIEHYGKYKGKISFDFIDGLKDRPDGKLILVTAITPTPAGEGKTTTSVGLGDGLNRIGKKAAICLREPSLGPCFGMKGGAAGGGYAQVVPMEDINLHFTGDFHAIGVANNLLAALIDNHIYWGNQLDIDTRRVAWRRVVDMNDRALRSIVGSLGGVANGFAREDGLDITVASEATAIRLTPLISSSSPPPAAESRRANSESIYLNSFAWGPESKGEERSPSRTMACSPLALSKLPAPPDSADWAARIRSTMRSNRPSGSSGAVLETSMEPGSASFRRRSAARPARASGSSLARTPPVGSSATRSSRRAP